MKNEKNLHAGHRKRLKTRFLENGLEKFEPHNILELLLFYSIPRKDTNDIAHELIERFGSLSAVFDASVNELTKVDYITENSAALIKLIHALSKAYLVDKTSHKDKLSGVEYIKEFLLSIYHGEKNECVYVLFLNNSFELLGHIKAHEGSVNSSTIDVRRVLEGIFKFNASMLVVAHNHPSGSVFPSMEDIQTTGQLLTIFSPFNIPVVEHFVVNEIDCYPIIHNTPSLKSQCDINKNLFGEK